MRSALTSSFLPESEYEDWQALVEGSPQGSVYANPAYLDALCEATGATFRILVARRDDELVGGVALYERRAGAGVRVAPRTLLYYNCIVLREPATKYPSVQTARLLEASTALEAALAAAGYERIVLKNHSSFSDARVFMAQGWSVRPGYSYVVPIDDLALAWDRVEQNLRRLVKRCTNDGLQLTEDDDFDSFWRMHAATTERKGTDLYLPEPAFKRFFTRLHGLGLCRLYHARLPSGQSISAQLVLLGKHAVSHTASAAADAAHLKMGATAFLRWKVFEALAEMGYAANDLTDAALNSVAHFKSQLGGTLELCLIFEKGWDNPGWARRLASAILGRR
jgi:Acetyltransferase (GNAT) domain